ncbi:O-antigen ligase family protein [Marinobacter segnicrescens]|uniref:O-antigen ligase family protein n=1 Tax=Marinobacter segnicrescens TaxID=430453 RepID=UPI003A8F4BDF
MGLENGIFRVGMAALGTWALASVLISDLMPTPLGGYADQRFLLVLLSGLLVTGSILTLLNQSQLRGCSLVSELLPFTMFSVSFLLLTVPFASQSYLWVEPGMYGFYFLAVGCTGVALARVDAAFGYTCFLILLVASGCALYGAMSINVYLFALLDGVTDLVDFLPWGFVNIRYWSHAATWLVPLLPLAVLVGPMKKHSLWRALVALGAGLWWWLLFLSAARGSVLGVLFGAVLVFLTVGRQSLPWVKVFVQYLVTGVLIWLVLSVLIPSFLAEEAQIRAISSDSSGRIPLFVEAWQMSLYNFPFGMGPQSWLTHDVLTSVYRESKKFGHPHNMYLMWAAEYGWLLMGFLAIVVLQAVRGFWRQRNVFREEGGENLLLLTGFTASVSAALFHAGVSAVFIAPGSMLIGLFVLIGFWALIQPAPTLSKEVGSGKTMLTYKLVAILLATIVAAAWVAWAREVAIYYSDMRSDESFYQEQGGGGIYPRFWFHGNFPRSADQTPTP